VGMDLQNQGVLITGASRGLGAALGRSLARRGARVALVARQRPPLDDLIATIRAEGFDAHALVYDIANKDAIHRIAGEAAARVGPINLLVNNVSTLGPLPMPLLLDTACEDLEQVFLTNVIGPFRLTKAIAGSMLARKTGTVVSISSDAAVEAYERWGAYGASKAAFDHLTRTFAAENPSVRFFSIDPGEMDTRMHEDALGPPQPGLARPEDVAEKIVALLATAKSGERVRP
jgi:NAD(P)-dependent dehydrogenase (short-subunit alcohol dehydrogenase family)